MAEIYTIGHSNQSIDAFIRLLEQHQIDRVIDVRAAPYSNYATQFNFEPLRNVLMRHGMDYHFEGKALGGRPTDPSCYEGSHDGRVVFGRVAAKPEFVEALERVIRHAAGARIALLCAEADPLACHRSILLSRILVERRVDVWHILADATLESHDQLCQRLLRECTPVQPDLFRHTSGVTLEDAYLLQEEKIARRRNEI